ncbi:MAG TPA: exodeoxyribonuclease VII large subunit [Clostridia bacterium]|nr:exodeoxyribonuclease VII large subunit [Clostridia bacterium]
MNNGFIILSVSQLNRYVKSLLESDPNLINLFVRGEISNFTNHYRSGHLYMTLKDESAVIKAVMFKSSAQRLQFLPQNGMKVIAMGRASLYDRDGQFQFYINDLQPDGVGALHTAYEQLKERLGREGLFDEKNKKPIPEYPERIGIITSPTGAALQDMLQILNRRWPVAEILLCPVLVQGEEAPRQICRAIRYFNERQPVDVLITGRGGGSIEELWAFNDETVARTIVDSRIPVISAVGHETDYTIADFAADLRAPTPSAAAELVSPDLAAVAEYVRSLEFSIEKATKNKINDRKVRLRDVTSTRALKEPLYNVEFRRMKLDRLTADLAGAARAEVSLQNACFRELAAKLDALSPLKVLSRGYSIAYDRRGDILSSVKGLLPDDEIDLRLSDGTAKCKVSGIEALGKKRKKPVAAK